MNFSTLKKFTACIVILAFALNTDIADFHLYSSPQSEDEIIRQFNDAKDQYLKTQYKTVFSRLSKIIGVIGEKNLDMKKIAGQCYLLLGAISEIENDPEKAKENYRKAWENFDTYSVEGVDLSTLPVYKEFFKAIIERITKPIYQEANKQRKKKFPWLLVAGGVIVLTVAVLLLTKKKKYTLTLNVGDGVTGNVEPTPGIIDAPNYNPYRYKKGETVNYSFTAKPGYSNLEVRLNETLVDNPGTITMNRNYTLRVQTLLTLVTDPTDAISIPEGGTAGLKAKLGAPPSQDKTIKVSAMVSSTSGNDPDISIVSGTELNFTAANWNQYQTVTLEAEEDDDDTEGEANIVLSGTDISSLTVKGKEADNDKLSVKITSPKEGDEVSGIVKIEAETGGINPIDKVELYIDSTKIHDDTQSPYSWEWNSSAITSKDIDIKVKAYDNQGNTAENIISVTVNNTGYFLTVSLTEGTFGTPSTNGYYPRNALVPYNYNSLPGYTDFSVKLDNNPVSSSGTILMDTNHTITVEAKPPKYKLTVNKGEGVNGSPESGAVNYNKGEQVSYNYTLQNNYVNLAVMLDGNPVDPSGTVTMDKDHTLNASAKKFTFETSPIDISVCEGNKYTFGVKLSGPPTGDLPATIKWFSGDTDLKISSGGNFLFTPSNWDEFQEVVVEALPDPDMQNGTAVLRIESTGTTLVHDIIISEHDLTNDSPPQPLFTNLMEGDSVSDDALIKIVVSDDTDDHISQVKLYIDDKVTKVFETPMSQYQYTWDTRTASLGNHKIKVTASDMCQLTGTETITVKVVNAPPKVADLRVTYSGSNIQFTVRATDDRGLNRINIYIDNFGTIFDSWTGSAVLDTTRVFTYPKSTFTPGNHTVRAIVFDQDSAQSTPKDKSFTIQ